MDTVVFNTDLPLVGLKDFFIAKRSAWILNRIFISAHDVFDYFEDTLRATE